MRVTICALLSLILSACVSVDDFILVTDNCPGFPPTGEVEQVLVEHMEFFDQLIEKGFMDRAYVVECSQGAFISILYAGQWKKEHVLKAMDDIGARKVGPRTFFGVPFLFQND